MLSACPWTATQFVPRAPNIRRLPTWPSESAAHDPYAGQGAPSCARGVTWPPPMTPSQGCWQPYPPSTWSKLARS
eukprot:8703774-Karenia_brevis.AAC.1